MTNVWIFRVVHRLWRMLGRRGAILLSYGTVWTLYGYGQITSPLPSQPGLRAVEELMPLDAWGWLWVVTGLTAVVASWLPQGRDWLGFLALPLMVLPWMASYALAWAGGDFSRGWIAVSVWGALAVPVLVVAGWSEPSHMKRASDA